MSETRPNYDAYDTSEDAKDCAIERRRENSRGYDVDAEPTPQPASVFAAVADDYEEAMRWAGSLGGAEL